MQIGLIGCGNMARALARGWGRPLLCADPVAERARSLAAEFGGEALASNAEVAARADLVILCHKPAQLAVGRARKSRRTHVRSRQILAGEQPLAALTGGLSATGSRSTGWFIPSLPVEVRQGAVVQAAGGAQEGEMTRQLDAAVAELFAELGRLVVLDDALVDVAMGLMSCGPAYVVALVAEAQIDAGVRGGIPAAQGGGAQVGADARRHRAGAAAPAADNDTLRTVAPRGRPRLGGVTARRSRRARARKRPSRAAFQRRTRRGARGWGRR